MRKLIMSYKKITLTLCIILHNGLNGSEPERSDSESRASAQSSNQLAPTHDSIDALLASHAQGLPLPINSAAIHPPIPIEDSSDRSENSSDESRPPTPPFYPFDSSPESDEVDQNNQNDFAMLQSSVAASSANNFYMDQERVIAIKKLLEKSQKLKSSSTQSASVVKMWNPNNPRPKHAMDEYGAAKIIQRCFRKNALRKENKTIMHAAVVDTIKKNNHTRLTYLIKQRDCPVDAEFHGEHALLLAAQDARSKCLKVLLQNGADPNFVDPDGDSLLYVACKRNGGKACAPMLKEAGATHTSVEHFGRKVGDIIPMHHREYSKNHLIDITLAAPERQRELDRKFRTFNSKTKGKK